MKSRIQILVFLEAFLAVFGFISNPLAGSQLAEFFSALHIRTSKFDINVLAKAVPGDDCNRPCRANDHKVCHFKFTLEFYQTLGGACNNCTKSNHTDCFNELCITGDGTERTFMSVNRQLPGPSIQVCRNDIVIVDVDNQMEGTATTIHWHGLLQFDTPFSDGVPYLTQCPVAFGNQFRYIFYARQKGTHLYHSHAGQHKANGIFGALIVRDDEERAGQLYDYDLADFYILCNDWMHVHAEDFYPGLPSTISLYKSILINGYGRFLNETTSTRTNAPMRIFTVDHSKRYLFRLINAASNVCPFQLQIESHNMTIIASDGSDIEPTTVDTLFFTSGERFDFVVGTQRHAGDYLIRVRSLKPCNGTFQVEDFAVLRYRPEFGRDDEKVADFVDRELPAINQTFEIQRGFNFPEKDKAIGTLVRGQAVKTVKKIVDSKTDEKFHLFLATPHVDNGYLFRKGNHLKYMVTSDHSNNNNIGTVNNISLALPNTPLLLHRDAFNESIFCDNSHNAYCIENTKLCECIHRIKVKFNSIVELVLIDFEDNSRHPFHLHGHKFYVMDRASFKRTSLASVMNLIKQREHVRDKVPMLKDTVTIPLKGFVRIKFKADNPGFWLAHCHFDYHLAVGMGFILQVGDVEEMKEPPEGLGRFCSNFEPSGLKI